MTTRDSVLAALRDAGAEGVSGTSIASRLGVSRVAVAKHVAALREAGYVIDATHGKGYALLSAPGTAVPSEVEPLLGDAFWVDVRGGAVTGSTNDDARALARSGAPEGTVVVAAQQTSGKGRLGRAWSSPAGGAYLSAVLRPPIAPFEAATLPLAVAVGVARGLESLGVEPTLKWPNDVWVGDGKIAGILLEMAGEGDRVEWVVAGVGVNIELPSAEGLANAPAAVRDSAPDVAPAQVAAAILDSIARTYTEWRDHGAEQALEWYRAHAALDGRDVVVSTLDGGTVAQGVVCGIDSDGRLLLRGADDTVVPVASGDVTLRRSDVK